MQKIMLSNFRRITGSCWVMKENDSRSLTPQMVGKMFAYNLPTDLYHHGCSLESSLPIE